MIRLDEAVTTARAAAQHRVPSIRSRLAYAPPRRRPAAFSSSLIEHRYGTPPRPCGASTWTTPSARSIAPLRRSYANTPASRSEVRSRRPSTAHPDDRRLRARRVRQTLGRRRHPARRLSPDLLRASHADVWCGGRRRLSSTRSLEVTMVIPVNTSGGILLEDAEDLLIAQLSEVLVRAADRDERLRSPQTDDAIRD